MREGFFPSITNGSANSAATVGTPIIAQNLFAISAQVVTVGTTTGNVKFQVSNDSVSTTQSSINWVDLPTQTVAYTTAGSFIIPKFDVCYNWIRVVNVPGSGTGTLSVNVKALGA